MMKEGSHPHLEMIASTWSKDSHGLFDYQCDRIQQRRFRIEGCCKLMRNERSSEVEAVSAPDFKKGKIPYDVYLFSSINVERFSPSEEPVFSMTVPENNSSTKGVDSYNEAYLVVRSLKARDGTQRGYPMEKGDVIKLGRMEFLVLEYRDTSRTYSLRETVFLDQDCTATFSAPDELIQGTCKFCLMDEVTEDNYLISPCSCKGSCLMVHVLCLRAWIDSKIKKEPNGISVQYNFTKFNCELCGDDFPLKVVRKGQEVQMFKIEKPAKPYLMLESLTEDKSEGEKILHIITEPEKEETIKIGRGRTCEIRMMDISVSRVHAHIKFDGQKFVLFDNQSKFGTLVKVLRSIRFGFDQIALQIGRTVMAFNLRQDVTQFRNQPPYIPALHRKL